MAQSEGSGRIQLPGLDLYRSFDWLRIAPTGFDARIDRNWEIPLVIPGRTEVLAPHLVLEAELTDSFGVYTSGVVDLLDWDRCSGSLLLRNWRPGDQVHSRFRAGAEKVKTLFQEFRIPLWERRSWPVITDGQAVRFPHRLDAKVRRGKGIRRRARQPHRVGDPGAKGIQLPVSGVT